MDSGKKDYQVSSNGFSFQFSEANINGFDCVNTSPGSFHLIHNNRSVNGRIVEETGNGKSFRVEIDGEVYDVQIKDALDQMLDTMGYTAGTGKQVSEIKAPMPGLVLDIAVTEGQVVNEGDRILILEAMKMENSLTIHASARIKRIAVVKGQAVEKGQVLVELE